MTDAPKTQTGSTVAKPVVAKQVGKKTEVSEAVVVETNSLNVSQPIHIDNARDAFLSMVKATYGDDVTIEDVQFVKVNHHVGKSATYYFTASIGG